MKYSKHQKAAKEYLTWLMEREQWAKWSRVQEGYSTGPTKFWEQNKMWKTDPKILPFRNINQYWRHTGYAGPPTAQAAQALSQHILVDMYAKAILGASPRQTIRWAVRKLNKIYKG